MAISKINNILKANISKVNGILAANIEQVNDIDWGIPQLTTPTNLTGTEVKDAILFDWDDAPSAEASYITNWQWSYITNLTSTPLVNLVTDTDVTIDTTQSGLTWIKFKVQALSNNTSVYLDSDYTAELTVNI